MAAIDNPKWADNLGYAFFKSMTLTIGSPGDAAHQVVTHAKCAAGCGKVLVVRDEAEGYPTRAFPDTCVECQLAAVAKPTAARQRQLTRER